MNKTIAILITLATPFAVHAQQQSLGSTMDVYVFPAEGQDEAQQSKDEVACYEWAAENTGTDPFDLADQEQANEQQAQAEHQAAEQAEEREEATEQELENFKSAFSVCLEAKEYMVKY